ncbi:retinal fascin [Salpingoeca rosetta]|uniref:Fascin n=1 Tax=Salpingoeca rosetta (strain ATCC 50818 / BSB-021) TaxID=946362 RepID=F2UQD9_SALR5|nr:retinal fascin [Salpingoeca rosetta]EGD79844.1 retinal fascin [Salpingoeca rosetta]|eukprot:XP_004988465.1 retinal fascin [Salpingoeca rosetta]
MSSPNALEWTLGLKNRATGKYLTQEAFGNAVNVNGGSLRQKQTWTLISAEDGSVHLRSYLGKYLYGDNDGNVKCDAESPSADTQWTIQPQPDGTWALISAKNYYFHGTGTNISAFLEAKEGVAAPGDGLWVVHLAMHPQINLYNSMRKRYVHLSGDELHCDEDIPWGDDALLNLIFFDDHPDGRYGIQSCNGKFLENSGRLVDQPNANCQFLLGFHDNQVSFLDSDGKFLSCVGGSGVLKTNKQKVTKDELFVIQDSQPQFIITDNRGKFVSVRNGFEVKADQREVTDFERFQMEITSEGNVFLRSNKLKYWTVRPDGTIGAESDSPNADCTFTVDYSAGNRVRFIAQNGNPVYVKPSGALMANAGGDPETTLFTLTIINRPTLLLRGQYGFVALKGASGRVECNRATGNLFVLENKDGFYHLKTQDGKYWGVDVDGVTANSSAPTDFVFEFVRPTHALIKHVESGKYLQGQQNGGFKAEGTSAGVNTLWEY